MNDIIRIENLSKSFGKIKAVDDLSFKVKEGELFAFLGVNGAGKSTTISAMCGTLKKDSGKIYIDGTDTDKSDKIIKDTFGVVFQTTVLDKGLTVYENLKHRASLYGITDQEFDKRVKEIDNLLDIKELLPRTFGKLSGGQKRKIDVARALINNPKILILDEPTTGLDPQTRITMWQAVNKLRKEKNLTVFLTTHYMEEAAEADYVVIIDGGKISAEGTPHQLKTTYTGDFITLYGVLEEQVKQLNKEYLKVGNTFRIKVDNTREASKLIIEHPDIFVDYETTKGKMDDVFLAVTGKSLTEDKQ
ncbi:MAG: ABC transporter ATP-binding protein [Clostridiales bacterium]|nr:ABC transporter ATP-binding protein [Clostridiales bacterium]